VKRRFIPEIFYGFPGGGRATGDWGTEMTGEGDRGRAYGKPAF